MQDSEDDKTSNYVSLAISEDSSSHSLIHTNRDVKDALSFSSNSHESSASANLRNLFGQSAKSGLQARLAMKAASMSAQA